MQSEQQQLGSRHANFNQVQVERVESQEEGLHNEVDIARETTVCSVDSQETRVFDLNVDPGGDTEIIDSTPCRSSFLPLLLTSKQRRVGRLCHRFNRRGGPLPRSRPLSGH